MGWLLDSTSAFDKLRNRNDRGKPSQSLYDIELQGIDGRPMDWKPLKGKFLLFVNVASECGFTGQYAALERLYQAHKDRLVVIGAPCNQFGGQEPGSEEDIQEFCSREFRISFPMTAKIKVKGSGMHPLYRWLTRKELNGLRNSRILWNFHKFLVSPEGRLLGSFASTTSPESRKITALLKE